MNLQMENTRINDAQRARRLQGSLTTEPEVAANILSLD